MIYSNCSQTFAISGGIQRSAKAIFWITESISATLRKFWKVTPSFVDRIVMAKSDIKSLAISTALKSPSRARSEVHSAGSSRPDAHAEMSDENITVVPRGPRRDGKTDWAAVDALTDAEIDAAIANDPDWAEFENVDWSEAVVIMPSKKKAISIRVDEDVLAFFRRGGDGYQGRINAVLRSYMQQTTKPKKRA